MSTGNRGVKTRSWKNRATPSKETVNGTVLAPVELDAEAEAIVGVVAGRLGLGGEGYDAMAQTWLRGIVDEGYGSTRRGLNRGRAAVKFLAGLLSGKRHKAAMEEAGLTWGLVTAFRFASPEFAKMYDAARGMMKDAMGAAVLDAAFDLATEGAEVRDRDGNVVGKKKSEKMLDRLLVMSGKEFRKDKGVDAGGGGGEKPSVSLTFNFGGGKSQSMGVVDVKAEE